MLAHRSAPSGPVAPMARADVTAPMARAEAPAPAARSRGTKPAAAAKPRHVGVIIDGNRRWAKQRRLSTAEGHRAGARKITEVLEWCDEEGIELATIWMLSTDNTNRSAEELTALTGIIVDAVTNITERGFHARIIGDPTVLGADAAACIDRAVNSAAAVSTADGTTRRLEVDLAVGYGGRAEILRAVRAAVAQQTDHGLSAEDVLAALTVEQVSDHLFTAGQPDPDLIIRTSGEMRLSGFLMWQSAHTEFVFTSTLWPDFSRADLEAALADYAQRDRRFGA